MDEQKQDLKHAGSITQHILALSWNIATDPLLYKKLASNPYSPTALQLYSEKFPDVNTSDIIHAVILAEPEGKYDRDFRLLDSKQQTDELHKQVVITDKASKRLILCQKKHVQKLNQLSEKILYNNLSNIVFETVDRKEIEQKYSQNQRRDLKLAIVIFIEERLKPQLDEESHPKQLLLKNFSTLASLLLLFYPLIGLYTKHIELKQILDSANKNTALKQILAIDSQKNSQGFPIQLTIPKINVDTKIEYVGLTARGAMDVPSNNTDVGWYKLGPSPGEIGNAVISGHIDERKGQSGVFNNLDKLKPGDKIYIKNDLGQTSSFVVRGSQTYSPGYVEDVFISNDSGIHLNLITCDGVWDRAKKSYSKRLVVFADII